MYYLSIDLIVEFIFIYVCIAYPTFSSTFKWFIQGFCISQKLILLFQTAVNICENAFFVTTVKKS